MANLNSFVGQFVGDLGAGVHGGRTFAQAASTATDECYVREWLAPQAAGGYVSYGEKTQTFFLTDEHAFTFANEDAPLICLALFSLPGALLLRFHASPRVVSLGGPVWAGTSMTMASFMVARNSSDPVRGPIW